MKVLLLAGGLGTRLSEETTEKPKPMVEINGKPIIWHLIDIFARQGIDDFVIALGYKGEVIKRWLKDMHDLDGDVSLSLRERKFTSESKEVLGSHTITGLDTGIDTQTGGRILKFFEKYPGQRVIVTYGDGLGNVSVSSLLQFHKSHGKLATVTAVRPPARFGHLQLDGDSVEHFGEKNQADEGWINGGFFILEPGVLGYIDSPIEPFESGALAKLALDEQLTAYQHFGFWQPMDTLREKIELEKIAASNNIAWLDLVSS